MNLTLECRYATYIGHIKSVSGPFCR